MARELNARDLKLVQYLNEAYGKEKQLETALTADISMTTDKTYRKRLQDHLKETRDHARRVKSRIRALGGTPEEVSVPGPEAVSDVASGAVNLANRAVAAAKGPAHMLRGTGEQEKLLKNAKTQYWNEFEEIATYYAIETFADTVGDKETREGREVRSGARRSGWRSFLEQLDPEAREGHRARGGSAALRNGGGGAQAASSSSSRERSSSKRSTGSSARAARARGEEPQSRSAKTARTHRGAKTTTKRSRAGAKGGSRARREDGAHERTGRPRPRRSAAAPAPRAAASAPKSRLPLAASPSVRTAARRRLARRRACGRSARPARGSRSAGARRGSPRARAPTRRRSARAGTGRRAARAARSASRSMPASRHSAARVSRGGTGFGPSAGRLARIGRRLRLGESRQRGAAAEHEALGERVRRQPVRAVQPVACALADRVEAAQRRPAVEVGRDPAHRVVRGGRDRHPLAVRVDADLVERVDDVREAAALHHRHVELDPLAGVELALDGERDLVARRELVHEPLAARRRRAARPRRGPPR